MAQQYKKFQIQGTASTGSYVTLYTTPANTEAMISTILVCNTSASPVTIRIGMDDGVGTPDSANGEWLIYDLVIDANDTVTFSLGVTMQASKYIRVSSSNIAANFTAFVMEVPALPSSAYWTQNGSDLYYTSGNVGIGTTNPETRLHIGGTSQFIKMDSGSTTHLYLGGENDFFALSHNRHPSTGVIDDAARSVGVLQYEDTAGWTFSANTGGSFTNRMRVGNDGKVLINGGANVNVNNNANMTLGLTINQGAADDEILAFKSSDVAHGVTTQLETDTYAKFQKHNATNGGLSITSASNSTGFAFGLYAYEGTNDTTKSSAANATVRVDAYRTNGTGVQAPSADANLFMVEGAGFAKFIVDQEGDYHYDGTGAAFDLYDDAELTRAFTNVISDPATIARSKWDEDVKYNRDDLVKAKLIGYVSPEEEAEGVRPLVNGAQLQRLHHGAIWQNHVQVKELKENMLQMEKSLEQRDRVIAALEQRLLLLEK